MRLVCILLVVAIGCAGCVPLNKKPDFSWEPIFVEAPRDGKPFLSNQLLSQIEKELISLENAMDFAEIEARAESVSQLRSLYGGYLLHKEQLRCAERDNATAFTDKLQVISDLKAIEGYMLNKKEGFKLPALEAAARFDEAVRGFEGEFLNLSQQEATSVEMASFLMGREVEGLHILVAAGLLALYWWYKRFFENWNSQFLTYVLVGVGSVFLAFPIILSFYLSDYRYRLWIIQGPAPFDKMGGGPFLIGKAISWLIIGFGLIIVGLQLRLHADKKSKSG